MSTGPENFHHDVLGIMDCEDQHLGLRTQFEHLLGRFDPIQLRHGHIENCHIRPQLLRHFHRLASVGGLRTTAIAPALDQIPHPRPYDLMIVGNKNGRFPLRHTESLATDWGRFKRIILPG
jgi:hypothetical protein